MPPWLALAALLSTAYGAMFHVWRGGGLRRLWLFVVAAWIGFGLGQAAGMVFGGTFLMLGEIHLAEASAGSLIALLVVNRPAA